MMQVNLSAKQKEAHRLTLTVTRREQLEEGVVRELRMDCSILNGSPARTCCAAHGTLLKVTWRPGWEGCLGETATCMCVAESLHCSPQTITTLLISSTQIQNEELKQ